LKYKRKGMPTRITQIRDPKFERTLLKVEGTLHLEDAELLEKICREVADQTERLVTLDLADLSFLDSDSASVLCRLKREQGVRLEGLHLFIGKVVELAEAYEASAKYLRLAEDANPGT
jgi:anti-anti-sigma regulatory factor